MFFIHDQEWKNGEKIKDYFWGFWCGIMNIHNKKLVHDDFKKTKEKYIFNLHKCIKTLYMKIL
jgi:hypothetical protein